MIAQSDPVLAPWLFGIVNNKPRRPGDFLKSVAEAALRADPENYAILYPALIVLQAKYPQYVDLAARVGA